MKHTPGPWKISLEAVNTNTLEIIGGRDRIAELNAMGVKLDNDKLFANARLIAAAPELLEALKSLRAVAYFQREITDSREGMDALAKVEAVLAKVK